jgi:hypothetical protein
MYTDVTVGSLLQVLLPVVVMHLYHAPPAAVSLFCVLMRLSILSEHDLCAICFMKLCVVCVSHVGTALEKCLTGRCAHSYCAAETATKERSHWRNTR